MRLKESNKTYDIIILFFLLLKKLVTFFIGPMHGEYVLNKNNNLNKNGLYLSFSVLAIFRQYQLSLSGTYIKAESCNRLLKNRLYNR